MANKVAGIDVHKKVLMVVVCDTDAAEWEFQRKRFGTTTYDLQELSAWLRARGVQQAVMESTALYWKPVWYELEPQMHLLWRRPFPTGHRGGASTTSGTPSAWYGGWWQGS